MFCLQTNESCHMSKPIQFYTHKSYQTQIGMPQHYILRLVYVFFNAQNPAFKQLLNFENDPFVIRTAFALADNFKLPFSIDDEICIGLQHAKEY